jgi:hypothetical protein
LFKEGVNANYYTQTPSLSREGASVAMRKGKKEAVTKAKT